MKHFLTIADYSKDELMHIISLAKKIKKETKSGIYKKYMPNKTLAMIFTKSSTRTRVSFETGIYQLGGTGLFLSSNDIQLGRGEPVEDTSKVISSMTDMIMIRNDSQKELEQFAKVSSVPVINGLTDKFHPVQLMADYLTICEYGLEKNLKVAYIGDGNNMASSWAMLASKMGFELNIASPVGYEVSKDILDLCDKFSKISRAKIVQTNDPQKASENCNVITTDTWVSMGQEQEKQKRLKDFQGFMVDTNMMNKASKDAIFLHCLPAYRDLEVSLEVFEKYDKVIFDEAENRLHIQKAIMVYLDKNR
ncbi:MAG: ornithine carbamoyltransferase [Campylobacteraceae bacterium 4484_166]|nr:MAG: ornithine carbamoyltransferase [Campylobacteraceae bacterium 4484_166]